MIFFISPFYRATTSNTSAMEQLKDFININEHLHERDNSRPLPPTLLEHRINEAIKTGDFQAAESLSDHLATREVFFQYIFLATLFLFASCSAFF